MAVRHGSQIVPTMYVEPQEKEGTYRAVTPQAEAEHIDAMLQALRTRQTVSFTSLDTTRDGYVYQLEKLGHRLSTYIVVPEEYHEH